MPDFARRWQHRDSLLLLALVALAVLAVGPTWADIARQGLRDAENAHVVMALPIAAWLLWLRRARLRNLRPRPSLLGAGLIAAGIAGELVGYATAVDVARHLGVILMVIGAIVSVAGARVLRDFRPALLALFFLLPVPGRFRQHIAIPLQQASARATEFLLGLVNIPIERTGNVLLINSHEVAIAEACNGMRMVSALALISFAFAFSIPMRNSLRIVILAISPVIALLVNIVRLVPTTLAYGYAEASTADLFHDLSGWGVLAIALAVLWAFLATLRWLEVPIDPYPVAPQEAMR